MRIDHGRDTQTCSRAKHDLRAVRVRRAGADLLDRISLQAGERQGLGFEIVENDHLLEIKSLDEIARLDDPVGVGERDALARDRACCGDDGRAGKKRAVIKQARLCRFCEATVGVGRDTGDCLGRSVGIAHQREPCIRAPDVGDQDGKTEMAGSAPGVRHFWRRHEVLVSTSGVEEEETRPDSRALRSRMSAVERLSAMGTL